MFFPIDTLGITRGYGAYECLRTYGRKPFRIKDHITRMKDACSQLFIDFPPEDIHKTINTLVEKNPDSELVFRLYVFDGCSVCDNYFAIICNSPSFFSSTHQMKPLSLKTVMDTRERVHIKSTSYSTAMIETKKANKEGFDDILFVDKDHYVRELSRANIFAVKGNTLYTPKENFLAGITRATILSIAKDYGYHPIEEKFTISWIIEAEEVFACSSIRGITPIKQIDKKVFSSHQHAEKLQKYFIDLPYNNSQKEPNLCSSL